MENQEPKGETAVTTPQSQGKSVDTHSYKGWLNSDSFWKRVMGVYGYSFVGGFVIGIVIIIAVILLAIPLAVLGAIF